MLCFGASGARGERRHRRYGKAVGVPGRIGPGPAFRGLALARHFEVIFGKVQLPAIRSSGPVVPSAGGRGDGGGGSSWQ